MRARSVSGPYAGYGRSPVLRIPQTTTPEYGVAIGQQTIPGVLALAAPNSELKRSAGKLGGDR